MPIFDIRTGLTRDETPEELAEVLASFAVSLEQARYDKFLAIAEYRRATSQNLTFAGMSIFLDAKTEDAIHKGIKGLERSPPGTVIMFEVQPGYFTPLDLVWMQALGDAGFSLVQSCFAHAASLCGLVWAAETIDALNEINIQDGWPT